jgi:hypothetical protein
MTQDAQTDTGSTIGASSAESAVLTGGLAVMTINGKRYNEKTPSKRLINVCEKCALNLRPECYIAIDHAANEAFGGDCQFRNVIYVAANVK